MTAPKAFIVVVLGLVATGYGVTSQAGDWAKPDIVNLDGLQNARTDMKDRAMMELGRRDGAKGHPEAYGELEVECTDRHPHSGDSYCNIQLNIVFTQPDDSERVEIQILDGDSQPLKMAYLQQMTIDNTMARVYVVGVQFVEGLKPKVRVGIKGSGKPIKGNARVTFLGARREKEDRTNWQVASNLPLFDRESRPLNRPTFLFLQ